MPHDHLSTANYAAVIADLRAKRDELDRVIEMLEAMSQIDHRAPATNMSGGFAMPPAQTSQASLGRLRLTHQNGIGERCMAVLRDQGRGQAMSTRQVTDLLIASGFVLNTKNPVNNVWSALSHRAKVSGDVERVGSNWRFVGTLPKGDPPHKEAVQTHMNGVPTLE